MYVVVFITAKDFDEAQKIARGLVADKLAACSNILKDVKSVFRWEEKLDQADEVMLIVKTRKSLLAKVIKKVKALHSYQVPEIIALPIVGGSKDYLNWVGASTVSK